MTTQASTRRNSLLPVLWLVGGVTAGVTTAILLHQALQSGLWQSFNRSLGGEAAMMGLPVAADTPAYWYIARAGGVLAYLLLWAATFWGIVMSSQATRKFLPPALVYSLHEFLPLLAMLFAIVHAAALLGDSYFDFTVDTLLIPFSAPYRPAWTGLGTIAAYLSATIIVSFYVRRRIGHNLWRLLHYMTYLVFVLALLHGIMSGTDSGTRGVQVMYFATGGSILFLTYFRILTAWPAANAKLPEQGTKPAQAA